MCIVETGKRILLAIQENIDTDAVIAGGWVRDQYVGNTPKDVDVWITKDFNPKILFDILPGGGGMRRFKTNSLIDSRLIHVTKFVYQGVDIDIICFDPEAIPDQISHNPVDTFDFGICQCWFDGEYNEGYQGTDAFWEDYHNETLTYLPNRVNDHRLDQIVNKRLPRLISKFPNHQIKGLVFDPELDTYVKQEPLLEPVAPTLPTSESSTSSAGPSMVEERLGSSLGVDSWESSTVSAEDVFAAARTISSLQETRQATAEEALATFRAPSALTVTQAARRRGLLPPGEFYREDLYTGMVNYLRTESIARDTP